MIYYTPDLMKIADKMLAECLDYQACFADPDLLLVAYEDGIWVTRMNDGVSLYNGEKLECITSETW